MSFAHFLYRNLKGYHLLVVVAILLTFAQVGADILSAYPLKFIIDNTAPKTPDPAFLGAQELIDFFKRFIPLNGTKGGVIGLAVTLFLALSLLKALLTFVLLYIAAFVGKQLTSRLSKNLFDHLQRLSISWHGQREHGDLVQRVTGNMADLEKFVADGLVDTLSGVLTIVGVIGIMACNNISLTLVSTVIIPLLGIIVYTYTRGIRAATKREKKAEGQVASIATEAMGKIMEIKAFNLEHFMFQLFTKASEKRLEEGRKAGSQQAQFTPLVDTILAIGTAVIIAIGAYSATSGQPLGPLKGEPITLGMLAIFLSFLTKLYQPMRNLAKLTTLSTSAAAAATRIEEVMEEQTEVLEVPPSYKGPTRLRGDIAYEDIYFCYGQSGPLVLKGVNLHIPTGKKVALVGLSGSGKTTLTNMLPRFYDTLPGWGSVKIDGVDINQYPLSILRQNISIVLQDSILFDGTIRDNIKIGRPTATDKEMIQAAEQACIHETIMKKPGGYDAKIINQGKNLSGGQRQRIAIDRAILRGAPIIILDEPTAALDVEAEAEVLRALDGLVEDRTVLMITHRLSTVGKVDEVIVLKDGRIAEQGSYKKLKSENGIFANLLKVQNIFDEEEEEETTWSFMRSAAERPDTSHAEAEIQLEVDGKVVSQRRLNKVVLTIGRVEQNDIRVPRDNPATHQVSRLHAKILWKDQQWVIEDADSKFGLYYNGQKIKERVLQNGDRISIATTIILIYVQQKSALPVPPHIAPPARIMLPQIAKILINVYAKLFDKRELDKTVLTIARQQQNANFDILIPSRFIGRTTHAQIVWENGVWLVKGRNGVRYNGDVVPQHIFNNGDCVYLAPSVALKYQVLQ